jgi:predicted ATPase
VLVLQQPELHLHPALQQALGDFLLALAKSGRQVILETHSDHLVSRLARRVAETDDAGDYVRLKLVHQTDEDGTVYQDAEIDDFGAIQWPEGFFDETSDEAIAILRAGLEKMERSQNQSGEDDGPGSD